MAPFASREAALAWATSIVGRDDVLFVDTETTGVRFGQDDVIDIGIVDHTGNIVMDQLVRPMVAVPADAEAIHGISNRQLQTAPTIVQLWPDVKALLDGKLLISYNADFDLRMLKFAATRRNLEPIHPFRWDCAMEAFAAWNGQSSHHRPGFRWINLETAARSLGIDPPTHRAIADAMVCLEVVQELSRRNRI
ncbi:MAG TPA: 3'-5' exonuclease [Thermomicrobiales bacterium]|nr:3'-5' exonuclease [Thermomicrobiales bacterium]HRA48537.1 3'-5' exonuclease [Thermomicrobiales bacterium]